MTRCDKILEMEVPNHWTKEEIDNFKEEYIQPTMSLLPSKPTSDAIVDKNIIDDVNLHSLSSSSSSCDKKNKDKPYSLVELIDVTCPNYKTGEKKYSVSLMDAALSECCHHLQAGGVVVAEPTSISQQQRTTTPFIKNTIATWILTTNELRFGPNAENTRYSFEWVEVCLILLIFNGSV